MARLSDRLSSLFRRAPDTANGQLHSLLARAATETPPHVRHALYEQLLTATLLLPTVRNAASTEALMAFTDTGALRTWAGKACTYASMSGREVFRIARQHHRELVRVNPAGPHSWDVTREEIAVLAEGGIPLSETAERQWKTINRGTTLHIAPMKNLPPEAFLEHLRETLSSHAVIDTAYLFRLYSDETKPQVTLGFTLAMSLPDPSALATVIDDIGQRIIPLVGQGQSISVLPLRDGSLRAAVSAQIIPVYQRPRTGER